MVKGITPIGQLAWSNLIQPRENLSRNLEWSCGLVLDEQLAAQIMEVCGRLIAERAAKEPQFNANPAELRYPFKPSEKKDAAGNKTVEPGKFVFSLKRKVQVNTRAGLRTQTPPVIYDGAGMVVTDSVVNIPPGSTVRLSYDLYTYDSAGNKGVGADLLSVQIISLNDDAPQFDAVDGAWTADQLNNAHAPAPGHPVPAAAPAPNPAYGAAAAPAAPQAYPAGVQPQPVQAPQYPQQPAAPAPAAPQAPAPQPVNVQSGPMPTWPQAQAPVAQPAQPATVLDLLRGQ